MICSMAYRTKKPELLEAWGIPQYEEGHIRVKAVTCGKPTCQACPHQFYAYYRTSAHSYRPDEKYLGRCDAKGYQFKRKHAGTRAKSRPKKTTRSMLHS